MSRLPTPGGDNGAWAAVLNDYLAVAHNADGTLRGAGLGWVNVKDHGAIGNGVADDTAAIQAAIATLAWPSTRSDVLLFPPGAYKISSTLLFDAGALTSTTALRIIGPGAELRTTTVGLTMMKVTDTGNNGVVAFHVQDLHFLPNANGVVCLQLNNVEMSTVEHCRFAGSFATGVKITGVSNYNSIIDCKFDNLARGVHINGNADFLNISRCKFCEQLVGSPLNWIECDSACNYVTIDECTFYCTGATLPAVRVHVAAGSGNGWQIHKNRFNECPQQAIALGYGGSSEAHSIIGNTFYHVAKDYIYSYGGNRTVIQGNAFLVLTGSAPANTYCNIRIADTFGAGQGGALVVAGNINYENPSRLLKMIKFDATCPNNSIVGNVGLGGVDAAHASNYLAGNITA